MQVRITVVWVESSRKEPGFAMIRHHACRSAAYHQRESVKPSTDSVDKPLAHGAQGMAVTGKSIVAEYLGMDGCGASSAHSFTAVNSCMSAMMSLQ